jgi:hypothetical protein
MIDQYFKLERAREEIQRLDIEIPRVITYIRDEDLLLRLKESEVRKMSPGLACQVAKHRMERGRFNEQHMCRFRKLASLSGFTGSIEPGVSLGSQRGEEVQMEVDVPSDYHSGVDNREDDDEDEDDDQADADIRDTISTLMTLTVDGPCVATVET